MAVDRDEPAVHRQDHEHRDSTTTLYRELLSMLTATAHSGHIIPS